jgi:hypothetical protein
MRICGECKWYEDKPTRECVVPTPMWLRKGGWYVAPDEDATTCRCFKARVVCEFCHGTGVHPYMSRRITTMPPIDVPEPCPACQGNNAACRGKEEL